jgi:hypothetical protein
LPVHLQGFHIRFLFRKNSLFAANVIMDDILENSGGSAIA